MSIGGAVVGEVKIRVSFDSGKAKPETKSLGNTVSNLTKSAHNLGRGFERMGRTISITGFVMGIVARRLIASFEGIAKSIIKISEEGANLDKAFTFLGDTLSALALSGMLTGNVFTDMMGIFNKMMEIAMASAGPWAIINAKIQELKNAIAEGALPAITDLATFLTEFNITPFTNALSEATTTFLTPIIAKIKELLGDENSGVIGIKEKFNAVAQIGGNFLAGVLEGFNQVMIKAAELIGNDASGIAGVSSKLGEFAAWALVLAPAGAVTGRIVGGFGSILTAISGVVAIIGGVATGGLLLAVAAVALDWEHWSTEVIPDLLDALDGLGKALGFSEGDGLRRFLKGVSFGVEIIVRGIETWINIITILIGKLNELKANWFDPTRGALPDAGQPINNRQSGGLIPRTGNYLMHAGERVSPRNEVNNNKNTTMYITIHNNDPQAVVREIRRVWLPI